VQSDFTATSPASNESSLNPSSSTKLPRSVFETVFAFPPNRDTMGGTAYLIVENSGNILIDVPAWNDTTAEFLHQQGGVRWLFLTHRGAIGKVKEIQQACGCEVMIQEQEAYLLPGIDVTTFQETVEISPESQAIWTSGHSPGSACLYYNRYGGVLFSGRHLLPNQQGNPVPLRIAKTFHWRRQIQNVQKLRDRFTPDTLQFICPGANTGFLRGQRCIDQAHDRLMQLDLETCLHLKPPI
jgi:glyoxylase-like metal-dependent hydrolase (beta-lactamase superfamily II)